jgi:hypothetical protein
MSDLGRIGSSGFCGQISIIVIIKLHENPSSGSRGNTCGDIDMAKITSNFRDGANVAKMNKTFCSVAIYVGKW